MQIMSSNARRPVPGFARAAAAFAASVAQLDQLRAGSAEAAAGLLHPGPSGPAQRLFTVALSGVISQQMANQPGARFEAGMVTSPAPLDMFSARHTPTGGTDADPRP